MRGYNSTTGKYEFVGYSQDINLKVPQKVLDMVNSNEEYQEGAAKAAEEMAARVTEYMAKIESGEANIKNIGYALKIISSGSGVHRSDWLRVDGLEYEIDLLDCTVTRVVDLKKVEPFMDGWISYDDKQKCYQIHYSDDNVHLLQEGESLEVWVKGIWVQTTVERRNEDDVFGWAFAGVDWCAPLIGHGARII